MMTRIPFLISAMALSCALWTGVAHANPASTELQQVTQPDGSIIELQQWGDEFAHGWETPPGFSVVRNRNTGYWEYGVRDLSGQLAPGGTIVGQGPPSSPRGLRPSASIVKEARAAFGGGVQAVPPPAQGAFNKLMIMVEFTDPGHQCSFTANDMETNVFGGGATGPGDLVDYFHEVSFGALDLDSGPAGIVGCFTVSDTRAEYDQGSKNAKDLVAEAVALADPFVDFSDYDNNGDGEVDNVAVIYAGCGPDNGCDNSGDDTVDDLWPHKSTVSPITVDGVDVKNYYIVPELIDDSPSPVIRTIGVMAHEFGHTFGLPDLYDTDGSSDGIGHWGLMGSGSWTSNTPGVENGEAPSHPSPWSKWRLGWITPTDLTGVNDGVDVPQAETTPFAIQLLANPGGPEQGGSGEYFLVENRQRTGFDVGLDGCGILIWHMEESQTNNKNEGHTTSDHRLVDLEEADGNEPNRGDAGDPFPGSTDNTLFDDTSTPHANLYDGSNTGVRVEIVSTDCEENMLVNVGDPVADLSISKWDSPDPVIAGEQLFYTINVHNGGPANATEVLVTDLLPDGVSYVTDTDSCSEVAPGELECELGELAADETRQFTIKVAVDPHLVDDAGGPTAITNTASVSGEQIDNDLSNNEASAATIVDDEADLLVSKLCKPDRPLLAGETGTCTIFIDNLGPSTARNVLVGDSYVSDGEFSITAVRPPTPCDIWGGMVVCEIGDIEPATAETLGRFEIEVDVTASEALDLNDIAQAQSVDTVDPDLSNNTAYGSISVDAVADLALSKDGDASVVAGTPLTYVLGVSNSGPSTAVNVVVKDVLPAGVIIDSVSGTGGASCNAGVPGDPFLPTTCTFDSLADGESESMTIEVTVLPGVTGLIHNDARVGSDTLDTDNSNNLATYATTITSEADLAVLKRDAPDPVLAGEQLFYELEVSNNGPSVALAVEVEDELPPEVILIQATVSTGEGTCALVELPPNTVSCQLGDMAPGAQLFVYLDVLVPSAVPGGTTLTNTANVRSPTPDTNGGNDQAVETTDVLAVADLEIVKTSDRDLYKPSSTIMYTLTVTNHGPGDAVAVEVTDLLPPPNTGHYVFDNGGCVVAEPNVTCSLGALAAGASTQFDLYWHVKGNQGLVTNEAWVEDTGPTVDPVVPNNHSVRTTLVQGKDTGKK